VRVKFRDGKYFTTKERSRDAKRAGKDVMNGKEGLVKN